MPMESLPLLPPLVTLPPPTITELAGTCLSGQLGLVTCQHPPVHYVLCNLGPCFMHHLFLIEKVLLHAPLGCAPLDIYLCFKTRLTHTLSVLLSRGVSKHDCGPHSDSEVCLVSVSDALLAETPIPPMPPMWLATQARVSIFSPNNSSNTCDLRGAQLISWMQSHIYECMI